MVVIHHDRYLAQADSNLIGLVFHIDAKRLYLGRYIRFIRQSIHRCRSAHCTAESNIVKLNETLHDTERYIVELNVRTQSILIALGGGDLHINGVAAKGE